MAVTMSFNYPAANGNVPGGGNFFGCGTSVDGNGVDSYLIAIFDTGVIPNVTIGTAEVVFTSNNKKQWAFSVTNAGIGSRKAIISAIAGGNAFEVASVDFTSIN